MPPLETELDEATDVWPSKVDARVVLTNTAQSAVDSRTIGRRLASVEGIEGVRVGPTSMLQDLLLLQDLPALAQLVVNGGAIQSVRGIESFRGRALKIDTGKNKRRTLDHLRGATVPHVTVVHGGRGDLNAIGGIDAVSTLDLFNFPELNMPVIGPTGVEYLGVHSGGATEIRDTESISSLRRLGLFACPKLTSIVGANASVEWLVVDSCRSLDWSSLGGLRALQTLTAIGCKKPVAITSLKKLVNLEQVSLNMCALDAPSTDVRMWWPRIAKATFGGISKDELRDLSKAMPSVVFSNGRITMTNGRDTDT